MEKHAHLTPIDAAAANRRIFPPVPEVVADHPVSSLEGDCVQSDSREDVQGHAGEDMAYEGKPLVMGK